jgi:hypothetical protein
MYGLSTSLDSVADRIENFLSWKDHLPTFSHKGVEIDSHNNVLGVLENTETGFTTYNWGANLVGTAGDTYYAKKSSTVPGIATNENFLQGRAELQTGVVGTPGKNDQYSTVLVPVTASRKTLESNYPKTNDAAANSAENPTGTVESITYKYYWNTSSFSANGITGGMIHDNATPVAATKLLTHWGFAAAFSKTSTDTLTLYVNHKMNGV